MKDYFDEAKSWREEKYDSAKVWLNRSLAGLLILSILLSISITANLFLFPLKTTQAFLYTLNETTGELTQLGAYNPEKMKSNWLMTRFLLVRYITNRESYDADNLDLPYQIAWAMSDKIIADSYADSVRTDNVHSPFYIYGKSKFVTVHVLSVNQLNDNTATIRFEQTITDRNAGSTEILQKEAIVKWIYTHPVSTEKMLTRDPLGFKVTYYQPTQVNINT